jgi:NAD(P)H dehydrogenase (quinone)
MKFAKSQGISDFVIEQLYWFLLDYQRNSFGLGAPTNAVLEVGGTPPEDFEQIVRRYAAVAHLSKRTFAAKLRAVCNLAKGLLTPAPNPDAIARRLEIPQIPLAALAADSIAWRESRGKSGGSVAKAMDTIKVPG